MFSPALDLISHSANLDHSTGGPRDAAVIQKLCALLVCKLPAILECSSDGFSYEETKSEGVPIWTETFRLVKRRHSPLLTSSLPT